MLARKVFHISKPVIGMSDMMFVVYDIIQGDYHYFLYSIIKDTWEHVDLPKYHCSQFNLSLTNGILAYRQTNQIDLFKIDGFKLQKLKPLPLQTSEAARMSPDGNYFVTYSGFVLQAFKNNKRYLGHKPVAALTPGNMNWCAPTKIVERFVTTKLSIVSIYDVVTHKTCRYRFNIIDADNYEFNSARCQNNIVALNAQNQLTNDDVVFLLDINQLTSLEEEPSPPLIVPKIITGKHVIDLSPNGRVAFCADLSSSNLTLLDIATGTECIFGDLFIPISNIWFVDNGLLLSTSQHSTRLIAYTAGTQKDDLVLDEMAKTSEDDLATRLAMIDFAKEVNRE